MQTVDIEAAKIDLVQLVDQAVRGHPFIITREGRPLVKVSLVEGADIANLLFTPR
jgi:antitoxin (DNA-binding transcriptional repressor) of toxin-antitoxin stability system